MIVKRIAFLLILLLPASLLWAANESYIQTLSGLIHKGDQCTVADDKFLNLPLLQWSQINNLSVSNVITFELRQDTTIFFQNKPFTCTLQLSVKYFTSRDQQTPTELNNINLVVQYDTATGKFYPVDASYRFKNAFKVIVTVDSIYSQQLGSQLPALFRIKNEIFIERKYPFNPSVNAVLNLEDEGPAASSGNANRIIGTPAQGKNRLLLSWDPQDFDPVFNGGALEAYDVEWTYIDSRSLDGVFLLLAGGNSGQCNLPVATVAAWMRNDATRVTVSTPSYPITIAYTDGYVLVRVRGVAYEGDIRKTTDWQYYVDNQSHIACYHIPAFEPTLNWQYSGTFAEEGKKTENVAFFDATLRARQNVVLSKDDPLAIVGETVYDAVGRAALNVLPSPVTEDRLKYFQAINHNSTGNPYSNKDVVLPDVNRCTLSAIAIDNQSGYGANLHTQYYSPANEVGAYTNAYYFTKYVPDAEGYPFAATQFMPDNTGRVLRQGGVGKTFQIGGGHDSRYFYGKPLQRDLERLFGMEVGTASHYLKNVVVDPNGQASVSYVDANGKTVATALVGEAPAALDPIPSSQASEARTNLDQLLIRPQDFAADAGQLVLQSTATFIAEVPGNFTLHYQIDPSALTTAPAQSPQFCSNCHYDYLVQVRNDCGVLVGQDISLPFQGIDVTCHAGAAAVLRSLQLNSLDIGQYYVSYTLRLNKDAINQHVDYYMAHNTDLKTVQKFFEEEVADAKLQGCYSECSTCLAKLGTEADFTTRMTGLLTDQAAKKYPGLTINPQSTYLTTWIHTTYASLLANCQALQASCQESVCDKKLDRMKIDVLPGGQYCLYDAATYDLLAGEATSVLNHKGANPGSYKDDPDITNFEFTDDEGFVRHIKDADVTMPEFIKAYLVHPEWADDFVKRHIEYCSYLWCSGTAGSSYVFDERLREKVLTGQQAIDEGLYSPAKYDYMINDNNGYSADPFFAPGGLGAAYRNGMLSTLANFSTTMNLDDNGRLPVKNLQQVIDWTLYCQPTDPNASTTAYDNSWTCTPSAGCRSLTREWELYRDFYLQLKSKYMEMARVAANPDCKNCFVGNDGISTALTACVPGIIPSGSCPGDNEFTLTTAPVVNAFPAPVGGYPDGVVDRTDIIIWDHHTPVTRPVSINIFARLIWLNNDPNCPQTIAYDPVFLTTVTMQPGESSVILGQTILNYSRRNGCFDYFYPSYQYTASVGGCPVYNPPSSGSACPTDPRYAAFKNKTRIWDEFVDVASYRTCMNNTPPPSASSSLAAARKAALDNLEALKTEWIGQLQAVRDEEDKRDEANGVPPRFASISNTLIEGLVAELYGLSAIYINNQTSVSELKVVSSLPSCTSCPYASAPLKSYHDVFADFVDPSLMAKGFTEELLEAAYPYDKTPVRTNDVSGDLNPTIYANVAALYSQSNAGNAADFHAYLQTQLGDDYHLTLPQLQDLMTRCANSCRVLNEPLILPAAFTINTAVTARSLTCTDVSTAWAAFSTAYPDVVPGTRLYRVLLTNYLNHRFGFMSSYDEYEAFTGSCSSNSGLVLYNKPGSPQLLADDSRCTADILSGVFDRAGQAYEYYVETERQRFRNQYISHCLANTAFLKLQGQQYEYHFTLYYYDQSGNLVKTIPPEGVRLLTDAQLDQLDRFRDLGSAACTALPVSPITDHDAILNSMSTQLASGVQSVEAWLYEASAADRGVRMMTPDNKYMYQMAIKNGKLWAELYSLVPDGNGNVEIVLSSEAAADVSANLPLQQWSHVVVQSTAAVTGNPLQLYLDGQLLTNLSTTQLPPYPFDWSITAGSPLSLPAEDIAQLKHLRVYSRALTAAEVLGNYQNGCLAPIEPLAVLNGPLKVWGRFNIPAPGGPTTTGPGSTVEYINRFIVPDHMLPTTYVYNSFEQVVKQSSPDGGTSNFWYDRLKRLVASQNEEQKEPAHRDAYNVARRFSYTKYDQQGRIAEVGELMAPVGEPDEDMVRSFPAEGHPNPTDPYYATHPNAFLTWLGSGQVRQATVTAYDEAPSWVPAPLTGTQHNLRKRVSAVAALATGNNPAVSRTAATYYSYDIAGNAVDIAQENKELANAEAEAGAGTDGLKHLHYDFDLISGKVNKLSYQSGFFDQFYYRYEYDNQNRLIGAYTSRFNFEPLSAWVQEATYSYYAHGPLARMELGKNKVQGLDYAYTLQGWLKGVNSTQLNPATDMGHDGQAGTPFSYVARDAFGFSLGYYDGDYKPIVTQAAGSSAFLQYQVPTPGTVAARNTESGKELFNGNISHALYAISQLDNGATAPYTYRYDELNRLTAMNRHSLITNGSTAPWNNSSIIQDYREQITYDGNGNIKAYKRNGAASQLNMDQLLYQYNYDAAGHLLNNRLRSVKDAVASGNYSVDIDNQVLDDNYQYDKIGNLIADGDDQAKLDYIYWNVYGKMKAIGKNDGSMLNYNYDASGNRISKSYATGQNLTKTFYIRDAKGSILGVYQKSNMNGFTWLEQDLYGVSRLGMINAGVAPSAANLSGNSDPLDNGIEGKRAYELTNHLGNVLATILDNKIGVDFNKDGVIDYYTANVSSAQNYYPGGMQQPGRIYNAGSYAYGFNGKRIDNEVSGIGNQYDYGFRIYDPRIVRFKSVDPLTKKYPYYSPYQFAGNSPIKFVDIDGLEPGINQPTTNKELKGKEGRMWAVNLAYDKTGGEDKYSASPVAETLGSYTTAVDKTKFFANNDGQGLNRTVNTNSQFVVTNENAFKSGKDLVNHLLGNFLWGIGPENYVFPENGKFSSELKGSIAVGETLTQWAKKGYKDNIYYWGMDKRGEINVDMNSGFTSLEHFLGSVSVKIGKVDDQTIKLEIFNVTSLSSGDINKDLFKGLVSPLKSTIRDGSTHMQTDHSNISQYFSLTISTSEADKLIKQFNGGDLPAKK